eukprot:6860851-Pyramimonas_sp.AAC.1
MGTVAAQQVLIDLDEGAGGKERPVEDLGQQRAPSAEGPTGRFSPPASSSRSIKTCWAATVPKSRAPAARNASARGPLAQRALLRKTWARRTDVFKQRLIKQNKLSSLTQRTRSGIKEIPCSRPCQRFGQLRSAEKLTCGTMRM